MQDRAWQAAALHTGSIISRARAEPVSQSESCFFAWHQVFLNRPLDNRNAE